jgi:uncharacterized membrane protein YfcA
MAPGELPLVAWLALAVGAVLVGFAKTAIGGAGSAAVVLFAAALPARESTGVLLPLLIAGDLLALSYYHRHAHWPTLVRLLPSVVPGLLLGTVFVAFADDRTMRMAIGTILLLITGFQLVARRRLPEGPASGAPARVAGVTAGFTTMTANAGGPVMTVYLVMSGLPMLGMLGTGAWFFFVVNVAKLPFSAGLGLISWSSLLVDLCLVPPMIAGGLAGLALIRRINQAQFEAAALALGAVAAGLLLVS